MTIHSSLAYTPDDLGLEALELVERLLSAGQLEHVAPLLDAAARLAPSDPRVSAFIAERALNHGDPEAALRALIPAWERGDGGPRIDWLLALAALSLRLGEIVDGLTGPPYESVEMELLGLLRNLEFGVCVELDLGVTPLEASWRLRTLLHWLGRCGREDLIDALREARVEGLEAAWEGLESPEPTHAPRLGAPSALRAEFEASSSLPPVAFSWAWACARTIEPGERALLASPHAAFAPLLAHAELRHLRGGVDEALPLPGARFEHVIAPLWISEAMSPVEALRELRRVMTHGAQLLLLAPGPRAELGGVRFEQRILERALERVGLIELGIEARHADGRRAEPQEAAYLLIRATKSVV